MSTAVTGVVIECIDAEKLMNFWAGLLECPCAFNPESGWGAAVSPQVTVMTKPTVAEDLPGLEKGSRVHMDIAVDDLPAATERALSLGATVKRGPFGEAAEGQYTVFADIEGNAFCLYTDPAGSHAEIIEMIRTGVIGG